MKNDRNWAPHSFYELELMISINEYHHKKLKFMIRSKHGPI